MGRVPRAAARGRRQTAMRLSPLFLLALLAGAKPTTAQTPAPLVEIDDTDRLNILTAPAAGGDGITRAYEPSEASKKLIATALKTGAHIRALENPCSRFSGLDCAARALDTWHRSLDQVVAANGGNGEDARVVVFGNSLIASDRITDIVRARLQERFGKGGGGFYLLDRLADYGGRWRTGKSNRRWDIYNFSQGARGPHAFGVPGAHHISQGRGARTDWRIEGDTRARIFWLDHKRSPSFTLLIDGKKFREIVPQKSGQLAIMELELPEGAKTLRLVANGARLVIHGIEMNAPVAGVRFDTHGIVAADARKWLRVDVPQFEAELAARDPSLVIVMLGGNEVRRVAWRRYSLATVERQTSLFLERLQNILPGSSCLVVGPLHAVEGKDHRRPFQTRAELAPVNRIYREQALAHGCAFFDTYASMGGDGSLLRFHKRRMLHADYVHPRADGLNFIGELIVQSMFQAWSESTGSRPLDGPKLNVGALRPDVMRGDSRPLTALQHEELFFRRLRALEQGKRQRLAAVVAGDGAGTDLATALKTRLALRFGDRGPGIVSGLAAGELSGPAIASAPDPLAFGIAAGLDGDRIHLEDAGRFAISLPEITPAIRSEGDVTRVPPTTTQLVWRQGPRTVQATTTFGRRTAALPDDVQAGPGGVRIVNLAGPASANSLSVTARGEGAIDILLVAREGADRGVVVDDLTHQSARELARLHPDVVAGQAAARRWDLMVFAPSASDLETQAAVTTGFFGDEEEAPSVATLALAALQSGTPTAHCLVFGPHGPRGLTAEVERLALGLATEAGCSFFSARAIIGDGTAWRGRGLWSASNGVTPTGSALLLDVFLADLMAHYDAATRKVASRVDDGGAR